MNDVVAFASKIVLYRAHRDIRRWFFWNGKCVAFVKGAPIKRRCPK